ncbi:MAG: hypothetical protein R3F17_01775 [Planctomycetota bacterium]
MTSPIADAGGEVHKVLTRDIPVALGFSVMLLVLPFLPRNGGA